MTSIPYHVPQRYPVDGVDYGQSGVIAALRYAALARTTQENFADKLGKSRPGSQRHEHSEDRRDHYRRQEIRWLACALNTALAARKRLSDEEVDRLKLVRMVEQPIVCGPEAQQAQLFGRK